MFRLRKYFFICVVTSFLFGSLGLLAVSARGCVITCAREAERREVRNDTTDSEVRCQELCAGVPAGGGRAAVPSSCPSGFTCVSGSARYTPDTPTTPSSVSAGSCAIVCTSAGGAAGPTRTVPEPNDAACQLRCAPVAGTTFPRSCLAGDRCQATFTASPPTTAPATPPATTAPAAPATPNRGPVALELSQAIDGVTVVSDFGNYIAVLFRYAIGLAGTAAVIMIVYGGFLFLLGSAMDDVGKGKQVIQDALIGLLLVLGSYLILATVNPNTLSLKLPDIRPIEVKNLASGQTSAFLTQNQLAQADSSRVACGSCTGEGCRGKVPSCPVTGTCSILPSQTLTGICSNFGTSCVYTASEPATPRQGETLCVNAPTGITNGGREPCYEDSDCREGGRIGACLYYQANAGLCTYGLVGHDCRCLGAGCGVREGGVIFQGATNNRGTGAFPCQSGLSCIFSERLTSRRDVSGVTNYASTVSWSCQNIDELRAAALREAAASPVRTPASP